jgi:hypothetical protein
MSRVAIVPLSYIPVMVIFRVGWLVATLMCLCLARQEVGSTYARIGLQLLTKFIDAYFYITYRLLGPHVQALECEKSGSVSCSITIFGLCHMRPLAANGFRKNHGVAVNVIIEYL